tara:strand:- start:28 stop:597 length:570 start_codon:yes stop_codon:yes gene_type:complete
MIKQNLAIYSIPILYEILKELEIDLNYNIIYIPDKTKLENQDLSNFLVITEKKNFKYNNFLQINFPLKIYKLIEKINIQFIKFKSKGNSNINIGKYILNINSRTLTMNSNTINLTEKEVNLILYLNSSTEPVNVKTLQLKVWGYKNSLESHTVETHIHRLRKKILSTFNLDDLIVSKKDGYYLELSKNI